MRDTDGPEPSDRHGILRVMGGHEIAGVLREAARTSRWAERTESLVNVLTADHISEACAAMRPREWEDLVPHDKLPPR